MVFAAACWRRLRWKKDQPPQASAQAICIASIVLTGTVSRRTSMLERIMSVVRLIITASRTSWEAAAWPGYTPGGTGSFRAVGALRPSNFRDADNAQAQFVSLRAQLLNVCAARFIDEPLGEGRRIKEEFHGCVPRRSRLTGGSFCR